MLALFNKPFNVLCQFTDNANRDTLRNYINIKGLYPCGRLDRDSEGLVILTDNGCLQHLISHPKHKLEKVYWVQVEGDPDAEALSRLRHGIRLKDGITAPAQVRFIQEPNIWPRNPPIRFRARIPTRWLELTIKEGRNRQVRRMTAAVGYPTLRLIRCAVGPWLLGNLLPGQWRETPLDYDALPKYWRDALKQRQWSVSPNKSPAKKRSVSKKNRSN